MVATTGAKLLPSEAIRALRERLLPQTTVLTPNIPEARLILEDSGQPHPSVGRVADLETLGRGLGGLGPRWVLVKGGHCPFTKDGVAARSEEDKEIVVDVLFGEEEPIRIETPYQSSMNTHGTGCSLACSSSLGPCRPPSFGPFPPFTNLSIPFVLFKVCRLIHFPSRNCLQPR